MKKAVAVATLLAALGAVAGWQGSARAAEKTKKGAAAGGGVEAILTNFTEKIRNAALKGDPATIQELYANDYLSISAVTGATGTKTDLINNYKSGKVKYESIDSSDLKVHVYGDTALVTIKADMKGKLGDQDFSGTYRVAWLWVKRGGKWQVVFLQSTKVPLQVRTG